MKRIFFTLLIALSAFAGRTQCSVDSTLQPGFYPAAGSAFASGTVGQLYTDTIQVVVMPDTTTGLGTFPFLSFQIDSISGLPPGISFTVNPSDSLIVVNPPNRGYGCILLSGTPAAGADISGPTSDGNYSIEIFYTATLDIFSVPTAFPESEPGYTMKIHGTALSVNEVSGSLRLFPNPADDFLSVQGLSGASANVRIFDTSGKLLRTEVVPENGQLALNALGAGIYFLELEQYGNVSRHKFVKK